MRLCRSWRIQSRSVNVCVVVLGDVEGGRNSSGNDRDCDDWSLCCIAARDAAAADEDDEEAAVLLDEWRCFFAMLEAVISLLYRTT
mmetsp:Transcript_21331/g.35197  ORF Transcript_21331/g.35197 Transcript_21331/m.35197 type:complete len:86 (-) Transcript_21331:16-273(-)